MKNLLLSFAVLCAALTVACGNAVIDQIDKLIIEATEKTQNAKSVQEVTEIAEELQAAMDVIDSEAGSKITFGKSVEESLTKYQEVALSKLAEFGIEVK